MWFQITTKRRDIRRHTVIFMCNILAHKHLPSWPQHLGPLPLFWVASDGRLGGAWVRRHDVKQVQKCLANTQTQLCRCVVISTFFFYISSPSSLIAEYSLLHVSCLDLFLGGLQSQYCPVHHCDIYHHTTVISLGIQHTGTTWYPCHAH